MSHLPTELKSAIKNIYSPAGFVIKNPVCETDPKGIEYGACRLKINDQTVSFRTAKITPIKIGQFVTTWKREKPNSPIVPFDEKDGISFMIIHVVSADKANQGQFVFDKVLLISQGIMSNNNSKGKLSFRIYPPWSNPTASQAKKSQAWQLNSFYSINQAGTADLANVRRLFKMGIIE